MFFSVLYTYFRSLNQRLRRQNMNAVNIVVNRGAVVDLADLPKKSIALDGYVRGPIVNVEEEKYSFDHHDGCVRLVTSATCVQVLDALLLGLDTKDHTIYINDVDGDTTLATWLLLNPHRIMEPQVRELVATVGAIDAHGPAYVVANQELANSFFQGVMSHVTDLQRARKYVEADLNKLLGDTIAKIDQLLDGTLEWAQRPLKDRCFEITHRGASGWVMARSADFIFDLLYAAGHTKAVAYQENPDGSITYTVGKKSEMVANFPVGPTPRGGTILNALNEREAGWGGSTTIGGAPRNADGSRSRLTPDEVFAIITNIVS